MSIARYDVNSANTNRQVTFFVQPSAAADVVADVFLALKGAANQYPFYGQVTGTPTALQELAQLRLSLAVRALSVYTPPVGIRILDNTDTEANGAFEITFEADEFGAYFHDDGVAGGGNRWPEDTTIDKHVVTDITDALGTGGMPLGPKTKDGLQSLLDNLATVSYDGGVTGPFGDLSSGGAIALPNGDVTAGAPVLDNAGGGATTPSGLTITFARAM